MPRYVLECNLGTEQPEQHVFVDTETYTDQLTWTGAGEFHSLRLGVAEFVRLEKSVIRSADRIDFTTADQFWAWLAKHVSMHRPTWIWAHKCAYDLPELEIFREIDQGRLQFKFMATDAGCFILRGTYLGRSVVFVDSLNWFRMPLEALGDLVQLKKMPMPDFEDPDGFWLGYCRRDVEILRAAILKLLAWHRVHDLGRFKYTVAGQSLQAWVHRFAPPVEFERLTEKQQTRYRDSGRRPVYPLIHSNEFVLKLERSAYYGPTAECYKLGRVEGPIFALDLQGCYPSLMREHAYPVRYLHQLERPPLSRVRQILETRECVATVELNAEDYDYPLRPKIASERALGRFWTVLPGPELRHALDANCVEAVGILAVYQRARPFVAYVDELAAIRQWHWDRGEDAFAFLTKAMLNALYGKLGQRSGRWQRREKVKPRYRFGEWLQGVMDSSVVHRYRATGPYVEQWGERGEGASSFPVIPAYVTSYARLKLAELQAVAGLGNVFYTYSDALHVNETGYRNLVDAGQVLAGQWGKLKVEHVYDWCRYYAAARYETPERRRVAGLNRQHRFDDDGQLWHLHFASWAETATTNLVGGLPLPGVLVTWEKYQLEESPGYRQLGPDGWTYPQWLPKEEKAKHFEDSPRRRRRQPVPF